MAYTALYRNFRPLKFKDMVGQEHITRTLKNQIIAGRVGHAYLFTGGRGTGKTTSAKILARAVNCLDVKDGEPCNVCEICKEILEGSLTDVVEMDAASNNSVEDIRNIRDEVNFLPTKAKYRVYIIDEVHMLSTGAFNALLKTLEEPPDHVKFILATTEPQKLPTTILSRCQRFDFKKISEEKIIQRLKRICKEAEIKINEDALKMIAILSEGHMRDAISILERCSQESIDTITVEEVKELVGLPSLTYIHDLAFGILQKNEISSLQVIDAIVNEGKDLYNFLWEVIKYFKDILVLKTTNQLNLYSEQEMIKIRELADMAEREQLLEIIYLLSDIENDMKWSSQKTIMFQVGIIKACKKSLDNHTELEKRITSLEAQVTHLQLNVSKNTSEVLIEQPTIVQKVEKQKEEKDCNKQQEKVAYGKVSEAWKKVIDTLRKNGKIRLYTALVNTKANEVSDLVWEIEFPNGLTSFNEKILQDMVNQKELMKEICKVTGKEIHLKYKDTKENHISTSEKSSIGDLGININIIE